MVHIPFLHQYEALKMIYIHTQQRRICINTCKLFHYMISVNFWLTVDILVNVTVNDSNVNQFNKRIFYISFVKTKIINLVNECHNNTMLI
jgi:hypothetical protein